jgi:hypothetical protein
MPDKIDINPNVNSNELHWADPQIVNFNISKAEIRLNA